MFSRLAVTLATLLLYTVAANGQASVPAPILAPEPMEHDPGQRDDLGLSTKTPHIEDWTTIYLDKSKLPVDDDGGFLINKTFMTGCTRELLRMQWRPNDPIDLYIIRPDGTAKRPVVLFLYNYNYDTDVFREERWCERAKANGFAVAGFGSALSPQRIHPPRSLGDWFVSDLQEALATSTHDVEMMLNYLQTRNDLDARQVAVFGQGSGGAVAVLAAAADPRIHALDLMEPWGDWPEWLRSSPLIPEQERIAYLTPDFLHGVSTLDPVNYLPQLKGRTVRIQQVMTDVTTPSAAKDKIASAAPQSDQITRYRDVQAETRDLGANGILGWLAKQVIGEDAHSGTQVQPASAGRNRRTRSRARAGTNFLPTNE